MEVTYLWPPWLSGSYHPRLELRPLKMSALSAPPDALKANSASSCGLAGGGRRPRLGLHPTVTSQYSSTTLYQVSYHIQ